MSDHPKEAERNLRRILICDDIYLDVFHFLAPSKVGLELALVSDRFDAIVDTHFKSRKWTLGVLVIGSEEILRLSDNFKKLPFPPKPLPNSIVGFAHVDICRINSADAIAFLQRIGRLFESNVCLELIIHEETNWNEFATSVWPLLNVSAIIKIHFGHPSDFQNFRRLTSPSILRDCSNLRMIIWDHGPFLQFPPDDSLGLSDGQAMCKWLLTPRADDQPKVLKYRFGDFYFPMDGLKTSFLSAKTTVGFIIRLRIFVSSGVGPFELVNSLTHEQLTCQKIDNEYDDNKDWWLIERSPIDKNSEQWAKWESKAMEDEENDWNVLGFSLTAFVILSLASGRQLSE